jgi:hypothetical protein
MVDERVAIGHKAGDEMLEISAHVGIDILLHDRYCFATSGAGHPQKSRRRDFALIVATLLAMRTHHSRAFGVKIERVLADLEPALAGDSGLALLDLGIEEFLDAAALQAHQVIVVAALIELKHRLARFEVMPYQQACLLELRQHAIHRRQPHVQTFGQQLLVDVFGSQVPDLALLKQVDDLEPRQRRL